MELVQSQVTGIETGTGLRPIETSLFFGCSENVGHNYASLRSSLHMHQFFCESFSICKLSILKCRKGIYWFNYFKLITGLLRPSLFFTINILLRNCFFCGQTCSTAPFIKRFSTSNGIVSFSCYFVLVCKGMKFDTSWVSAKYSDLLSVTVGIFKLQNNLFTNCCADDNSPSSISCGISLKVTVLAT